jgi:hypothetical protein
LMAMLLELLCCMWNMCNRVESGATTSVVVARVGEAKRDQCTKVLIVGVRKRQSNRPH